MFARTLALVAALALAAPATAQRQSLGYQFLEGIKKRDGAAVNKVVSQPGIGSAVIDYQANGEAAIHLLARAGDLQYLAFVLGQGADPDLRNAKGDTPLTIAVDANQGAAIDLLVKRKAKLEYGNRSGETPLIRAVQNRNLELASQLLKLGANPDTRDIIAGKSARDYATADNRSPQLAKLLAGAPKVTKKAVSGPQLR